MAVRVGDRVKQGKRSGVVKALRPGNSVDVQFDDVSFIIRQNAADLTVVRENPGARGGLTPAEREGLPDSAFALPGRRFPIHDANHGRIALQYILRGFVSEGDVDRVVNAVLRRWGSDRSVRAFYEKHKAKLTRGNVEKVHARRYAANPAGEVYDPTKEQFRAVVQGVYESLVRKELGLSYKAPFESAGGKRLDSGLSADRKRQLLSSAFAIATRQGQRHGWLKEGTQEPTQKGRQRSFERLHDQTQRVHAEENREDWERTLAGVRKGGHFRVVTEVVRGQTRYVVQPRPSPDLVQIPEYRMSAVNAQEDADRAEAAFRAAPAALKAKQNPYYARAKIGGVDDILDVADEGASKVIIGEGLDLGTQTLGEIASKLGVSLNVLLGHGWVEMPEGVDEETGRPLWKEFKPIRLSQMSVKGRLEKIPNIGPDTRVDPKLRGGRIRREVILWSIENAERGLGPVRKSYAAGERFDAAALEAEEKQRLEYARAERRQKLKDQGKTRWEIEKAVGEMGLGGGKLFKFANKDDRDASLEALNSFIPVQVTAAPPASEPYQTTAPSPPAPAPKPAETSYPTPVESFKAGTPLPKDYTLVDKELALGVKELARVPLDKRYFKPVSYRARPYSKAELKKLAEQQAEAERLAAEAARKAAEHEAARGKAAPPLPRPARAEPPWNVQDYAKSAMKPGSVLVVDEGRPGIPAFAYYAPKTAPVDQSELYTFLKESVYGTRVKTFADDAEDHQVLAWGNADEAFEAYSAAAEDDPATFGRVRDLLKPERRREADERAASKAASAEKAAQQRKQFTAKTPVRYRPTAAEAQERRKQAILGLGGAPGKGGRLSAARVAGLGIRVSPAEERRYAYETFSAPALDPSDLSVVDPQAFKKMVDEREAQLGREYREANKATTIPILEKERIQKRAIKDVETSLGQLGIAPTEASNLAAAFENAIMENRDLFIKRVVEPAVDSSQAEKAVTVDIRPEKALLGEDKDYLSTFWDVEFVPGAEGKPEARYVLYIPQYQTYVSRVKRVLGRTVVQSETGFVKPRKKGAKVGPKSPRQPGGDTYLKEDENLNSLLKDLGAANASGDFIRATEIQNKLAALRQQENSIRGARMLQTYAAEREKAENIPVLNKLARFTLPSSADESDIFGATLTIGAAPTEANGWVEDLSFTRSMRGQKMAARMRNQKVADPRYGYMKFVTTNPTLAFYTIQLWNTPELFTGFSITLPSPVYVGGREEFEVVNLPPVSDPDNKYKSALFGYYKGIAMEVLLQGALADAVLKGEFDKAARIYLNLYGTADIVGAKDKGLRGALRDIARKVRPIERRPQGEVDESEKEAKDDIKFLSVARARKAQQGQPTDEIDAMLVSLRADLKEMTKGASFELTPLAKIMKAQGGPSPAQNIVSDAWHLIQDKGAWTKLIGGRPTTKLLENRRYFR